MEGSAERKDDENGNGDYGESDGNTWQIKNSKVSSELARDHANHDNSDKNSNAVFDAARIKSEESKSDDGWCVDAKSFDADDLPKESNERHNDGEEKNETHCFDRDALPDEAGEKWMKRHKYMKYQK